MAKTFFTFLVLTLFAISFLNRIHQASSSRVLLQQYGCGQGGGGYSSGGDKGRGSGDSCYGCDICDHVGYGGKGPFCPSVPWFNHGPWWWLRGHKTFTQARAPNPTP